MHNKSLVLFLLDWNLILDSETLFMLPTFEESYILLFLFQEKLFYTFLAVKKFSLVLFGRLCLFNFWFLDKFLFFDYFVVCIFLSPQFVVNGVVLIYYMIHLVYNRNFIIRNIVFFLLLTVSWYIWCNI